MIETLYQKFKLSTGATTDTRAIAKDNIFFALKGENFNGNKFAKAALEAGASFAVIDEKEYQIDSRYLLVEDVLIALQQLAAHHRAQFNIAVIGITGSNGKTTTKELINAVLSTSFKTFATQGNYNNHIGVPLSLLSITEDTKIAIIEMGANHVGEIAAYCEWVKPTHGLITNIGSAHLEGFGSYENIIIGKSELYNELRNNKKIVFFNQDDALLSDIIKDYDYKISYGSEGEVDTLVTMESAFPTVSVSAEGETYKTRLFGEYNFANISAALALADYFDIKPEYIRAALENYVPQNNRSEIRQLDSNIIILDAYNANPTSVKAAVKSFSSLSVSNKKIIVGDMFELGKESKKLHQDIVNYIESHSFDEIVYVGEEFSACSSKRNAIFFNNTKEAKKWFENKDFKQATILIKGSRGMKLESLLDKKS